MEDLRFEIYIGENMVQGQNKSSIAIENVVAIVFPEFIVPHGQIGLSGKCYRDQTNCFWALGQLKDYICEWFNIVGEKDRIIAKIHLNKQSVCKTFSGEKIIDLIDKIEKCDNYLSLRNFDI